MINADTLQAKDYSRNNWTMSDPEAKKERHETVFPEDKKKAYVLGEEMVSGIWKSPAGSNRYEQKQTGSLHNRDLQHSG